MQEDEMLFHRATQVVAEWADVLELEIYPVIEDDEAGDAARAVFGK